MLKVILVTVLGWFSLYGDFQCNYNPRLTRYLVQKQFFNAENFCLLDVGASGGIADYWKAFGNDLAGFGFDPLVKECERLNAINTFSKVQYVPGFVIAEDEKLDQHKKSQTSIAYEMTCTFARSSAWKMIKDLKMDHCKELFNNGEQVVLSQDHISLDRFCLKKGVKSVDFIKVDTDGTDYAVLRGAEKLLGEENMLGVLIEINFNGELHPHANSWRNIDHFLAEKGLSLFDLSIRRYTKGELPGKFVYRIPAQTTSGQITQGDAFYLKDFVQMKKMGKQVPTIQLLKMVCLQEIFGLPDCAAELLITFRDQLSSVIDVNLCLDLLTADVGLYKSYEKHQQEFHKDPTQFYPPALTQTRIINYLKKMLKS
jgi:FkbM family methyltransferase